MSNVFSFSPFSQYNRTAVGPLLLKVRNSRRFPGQTAVSLLILEFTNFHILADAVCGMHYSETQLPFFSASLILFDCGSAATKA